MVATILWALIGGTVIGMLGKWFAPTDREIPLYATVLCGIGGVFLGNWLYVDVLGFQQATARIDWWRHAWQIAVAALLVVAVASLRRPRKVPRKPA